VKSFRITDIGKASRITLVLFVSLLFIALLITLSFAETKKLTVPKIDAPPKIDGALDDPCWQTAAKGDGFTLSDIGKAATEQTEFFVCFDSTSLYFGIYCHDSQPDKIVASQKERDGNLWNDDHIGITLDTFHEHRSSDEFAVNAIGTQSDWRGRGTAEKIEWKGDWFASAKRVADGWIAEMAIPFSILNYKADTTTMGLNVYRNEQRLNEVSWWVYSKSGNPDEQEGDLEGLDLPPPRKKPLLIMPYMLFHTEEGGSKGRFGFDMKHQFGDDDTLLFTAFPDFGYVESAVKSIDFSYTAHRYYDNRPFFQEASSVFYSSYVDTSLIPDFDYGIKIFGRQDKLDYGLMSCMDIGKRIDSIITASCDLPSQTDLSFDVVSRDDDEVNNKVLSFSLSSEPVPSATLWVSGAKSITSGAEKDGTDFNAGLWRYKSPWAFWGHYGRCSQFFYPATSYLDYPGSRYWDIGGEYDVERPGKSLRGYSFYGDLSRSWDIDRGLIDRNTYISGSLDYANHTSWSFSRYWGPHIANYDAEPGTPYYWYSDSTNRMSFGFNTDDQYRSGSISYSWGDVAGGPSKSFRIRCGFLPVKRFSNSITFQHVNRDNPEEGKISKWLAIIGAKYEITPEKSISARLVHQEEGINLTLSYRQQVRKGLDIYALFGDYDADKTVKKLSIKLVMTI